MYPTHSISLGLKFSLSSEDAQNFPANLTNVTGPSVTLFGGWQQDINRTFKDNNMNIEEHSKGYNPFLIRMSNPAKSDRGTYNV